MTMLEVIFWIGSIIVIYTYLLYPVTIFLLGRLRQQPEHGGHFQPEVSVVIATYNEGNYLERRIANIKEQNYPQDKLELIVVSDGSTDSTSKILKDYAGQQIKVIEFTENRGKADAVNEGVRAASGEVVVFADTRQLFNKDAISALAGHFENRDIGAVSGELVLTKNEDSDQADSVGLYWKYEKMIRTSESRLDSVVGVTGSIYAIRKDLYSPLPPRALLDDVITPMRIIGKGYRVIMDKNAVAFEPVVSSIGGEFKRKVRTLAGNYEVLNIMPWIMNPWKNRLFLQWVSHKFLRLIVPYLLITILILSTVLPGAFYCVALVLQVVFYTGALGGWLLTRYGRSPGLLGILTTFVVLNIAAMAGMIAYISGARQTVWKK